MNGIPVLNVEGEGIAQAWENSLLALFEQTQGAAENNPDKKFMMMDFVYDPPLKNIWNQVYATDQAAFLAGYAAASVTKTGKVGVFGGVDIPQVTGFMDGFASFLLKHAVIDLLMRFPDPSSRRSIPAVFFCHSLLDRPLFRLDSLRQIGAILFRSP